MDLCYNKENREEIIFIKFCGNLIKLIWVRWVWGCRNDDIHEEERGFDGSLLIEFFNLIWLEIENLDYIRAARWNDNNLIKDKDITKSTLTIYLILCNRGSTGCQDLRKLFRLAIGCHKTREKS